MATETLRQVETAAADSASLRSFRRGLAAGLPRLLPLLILIALVVLWEIASARRWIDPFFFSSPSAIWQVLARQFTTGTIYRHLFATLYEAAWGLASGFAAGALLGWLAAQSRLVGTVAEPAMVLLNAIPRIVIAPLFIMWLGIGPNSKIALSFFLVFVVVFFAVYSGIREVDPTLVGRVRMLGGSGWTLIREVYGPAVLAWVFASLRLTVGFAFTGAVVGEFIASSRGLGYLLNFAQNSQNASLMLANVILILLIILALNVAVQALERRATAWKRAR
jgi:NitT/TauT family transport system permease protein